METRKATPLGGCDGTIGNPALAAEREELLYRAWLAIQKLNLGDGLEVRKQSWAHYPVRVTREMEEAREALLLTEWFRGKQAAPSWHYNVHDYCMPTRTLTALVESFEMLAENPSKIEKATRDWYD